MRATITELMHANHLEVFNERDSARRCATIEHVCAAGLGIRCCNRARRLRRRVVQHAESRAVNPRVCPEPPAPHWIDLTETNEEAS
jgi:hypothetical protein